MSLSFIPYYEETRFLQGSVSDELYINRAKKAAEKLKWKVVHYQPNNLKAFGYGRTKLMPYEITVSCKDGILHLHSKSAIGHFYDAGRNKRNITSLLSTIDKIETEVKINSSVEGIDELPLEVIDDNYINQKEDDISTSSNKIKSFFKLLVPAKGYWATPILSYIMIYLFIAMVMSSHLFWNFTLSDLRVWGSNEQLLTLNGSWWRLLTSFFLHDGFIHLAGNLYFFLVIGNILEPYLGSIRFFLLYLICGLLASWSSLAWNVMMSSVGASGAILGLYGAAIVLLLFKKESPIVRRTLLINCVLMAAYAIINGLTSDSNTIDNACHMGGFFSGAALMGLWIRSNKNTSFKFNQGKNIVTGLVFLVLTSTLFYFIAPRDLVPYFNKMELFHSMETNALKLSYSSNKYYDKKTYAINLKEDGVFLWKENLKLLQSFKELRLPKRYRDNNKMLEEYCRLYIQYYNLLYKKYFNDTPKYNKEIRNIESNLSLILNVYKSRNQVR